jgi:hypothetical protein
MDSAQDEAAMRKAETHYEQVPVEVAETVLEKATTLAAILRAYPALFPMLDREVASPPPKRGERENVLPRERR